MPNELFVFGANGANGANPPHKVHMHDAEKSFMQEQIVNLRKENEALKQENIRSWPAIAIRVILYVTAGVLVINGILATAEKPLINFGEGCAWCKAGVGHVMNFVYYDMMDLWENTQLQIITNCTVPQVDVQQLAKNLQDKFANETVIYDNCQEGQMDGTEFKMAQISWFGDMAYSEKIPHEKKVYQCASPLSAFNNLVAEAIKTPQSTVVDHDCAKWVWFWFCVKAIPFCGVNGGILVLTCYKYIRDWVKKPQENAQEKDTE